MDAHAQAVKRPAHLGEHGKSISTPSLVVGDSKINLRRHWGGDPEIVGHQVLDLLAAARAAKPGSLFHTGSGLFAS
jgi:hypothetical protein